MTVDALVLAAESVGEFLKEILVDGPSRRRDDQFETLPLVVQRCRPADLHIRRRHPIDRELRPGLVLQLAPGRCDLRGVGFLGHAPQCPGIVVLEIRIQQTEGGKEPRRRRDDHAAHIERPGHLAGEQWTIATEGEQRERARVSPPLARHGPDRPDHVGRRDTEGAVGCLLDGQPKRIGDLGLESVARLLGLDGQRTADQVLLVEIAENDIGIGDGDRLAALGVADGARNRAGRLRADLKGTAFIETHQRAAARADLREIDRRNLERITRAGKQPRADHDPGADGIFLGAQHAAVLDHRRLCRRAAHVERDDPLERLGVGNGLRSDDTTGRPRLDDIDRAFRGSTVRGEAAIRLHQQQGRGNARGIEAEPQRVEIGCDDRHHVGVDHRRRCPLVLLDLREHLIGNAVDEIRRQLLDGLLDHQFVHRVGERVDEAHGNRLNALVDQRLHLCPRIGRVERMLDLTRRPDALVHRPPQVALHQRRRLLPRHVIKTRHPERAQL